MKKEIIDENLGILKLGDSSYTTRLSNKFKDRKAYEPSNPKMIRGFIPGVVVEVLVKEGHKVKAGDDLLILDSMKMKNRIKCILDGIIEKIEVKPGDKVGKGALFLTLR